MKFVKMHRVSIDAAKDLLKQGGTIAYPTEAVYGLGCDPFQSSAVSNIQALKGRESDKGFIVLISSWAQLFDLIAPMTEAALAPARETWPGFVTWIFPKAPSLPDWITGHRDTIAIRMTAHPIARALCSDLPLLSTSANLSGQPPVNAAVELDLQFSNHIDGFIDGALGGFSQPSAIFDILSGRQIR